MFVGRCPTGDDPMTVIVETLCTGVLAADSYTGNVGAALNKCHMDCSNRGLCDYSTGICQCFNGFYGANCAITDPNLAYDYWNKGTGPYNKARQRIY